MAKYADASGSLAVSRRPRGTARTLSKTLADSSAVSANRLSRIPAEPAEIAQARVFERLLQAESAELQEHVHRVARDQPPGTDDAQPAGELAQLRARLNEVEGLLQALRGRFPQSAPDGER